MNVDHGDGIESQRNDTKNGGGSSAEKVSWGAECRALTDCCLLTAAQRRFRCALFPFICTQVLNYVESFLFCSFSKCITFSILHLLLQRIGICVSFANCVIIYYCRDITHTWDSVYDRTKARARAWDKHILHAALARATFFARSGVCSLLFSTFEDSFMQISIDYTSHYSYAPESKRARCALCVCIRRNSSKQ